MLQGTERSRSTVAYVMIRFSCKRLESYLLQSMTEDRTQYTRTQTQTHTYTHTHERTSTHSHRHTHTHMRAHTHTPADRQTDRQTDRPTRARTCTQIPACAGAGCWISARLLGRYRHLWERWNGRARRLDSRSSNSTFSTDSWAAGMYCRAEAC